MYSIYPNIILKIKKILKEKKLKLLTERPEVFVQKKLRFYHAVCQGKEGKKVFFKSILKRERNIKNRFFNEINFLRKAKENPKLAKIVPQILDFSLKSDFPFLLYQFLPGKSKKREDKFSEKEIKKVIKLMKVINSIENNFDFIPKKPLFNFFYFKKNISLLLKNLKTQKGLTLSVKPSLIENFIEKNKKIFHLVKPKLTHGDFSEANLIFYKNGIKIVDWEHVHLRNPLYDFVSFWTKRKREKKEQKIIEREYLKSKERLKFFSPLFKLALIEISLRDLIFFEENLKILEGEKENEIIKKIKLNRKKEIEETLRLLKEYL